MEIERIGEHRQEEWAIRTMATNLEDDLRKFVKKGDWPYVEALLRHTARHPDLYRRRGYTWRDATLIAHKTTMKGRTIAVAVDFGPVPTDAQIEHAAKIGGAK